MSRVMLQGLNHVAAVLHLAIFFGCSRLIGLAEAALAAALLQDASPDLGAPSGSCRTFTRSSLSMHWNNVRVSTQSSLSMHWKNVREHTSSILTWV